MPVLQVFNAQNETVGEVALDDAIFDGRVREHLIHEVVVMQRAGRRSGTASAKTRSEVKGSGAKPWRQKGTGRARAGRRRSPLWRHGGVIFPPKPRSYAFRPPRKVRRGALIAALNRKIADERVRVLDDLVLPEARSREVVKLLDRLGIRGKVLFVTAGPDPEVRRATWNVPGTKSLPAVGVNVLDVEDADVLLCSRAGIEAVQERLRRALAARRPAAGRAADAAEAGGGEPEEGS